MRESVDLSSNQRNVKKNAYVRIILRNISRAEHIYTQWYCITQETIHFQSSFIEEYGTRVQSDFPTRRDVVQC